MDRDIQDLIDLYGIHHSPVLDSTPNCDQTNTNQHTLDMDISSPYSSFRPTSLPNIPIPVRTFYLDIKPIPLLNLQVKPTQHLFSPIPEQSHLRKDAGSTNADS